jgi:hypothetical protein
LEKQQVPGVSGADTCSGQTLVRLVILYFSYLFPKKKGYEQLLMPTAFS